MASWQENEEQCFNYLVKKYPNKHFTKEGESDSTKPDIGVLSESHGKFYVEVKSMQSQCGQFVLFPNSKTRKFEFSKGNDSKENAFTDKIIAAMNADFDSFKPSTAGTDIDIDQSIMFNWIKNEYKEKGARFFITQDASSFIIFPIEKLDSYFNVSGKYRIKKSGSRPAAKSNFDFIAAILKKKGITIKAFNFVGDKLILKSVSCLNDERFTIGNYDFMLSEKSAGTYEVRKLSNTNNANVIFSITLKPGVKQNLQDLRDFEESINC